MMQKIPDWLNGYLDALLGERSTSSSARRAETEEHTRLMKFSRLLKRRAASEEPEPTLEFVANLESQMLRILAGSSPRVTRVPLWRLVWFRPVAGVVAAAAVFFLAFLLVRGPLLTVSPVAAPAAVMREQAKAPALAASPAPAPAAPSTGGADKLAGQAAPPAPTGAAPAFGFSSRPLPELVAQAQAILVGRVLSESTPPPAFNEPYTPRVVVAVERYLKGPLPNDQVALLTVARAGSFAMFAPGQRVLVMAGSPDRNGDLLVLPDSKAAYVLTPDGLAAPLIQASPPEQVGLTEVQLIGQIMAILNDGQ